MTGSGLSDLGTDQFYSPERIVVVEYGPPHDEIVSTLPESVLRRHHSVLIIGS